MLDSLLDTVHILRQTVFDTHDLSEAGFIPIFTWLIANILMGV